VHMNSVWQGKDGYLLVFYHNETSKTGRTGEVVELSSDLREHRRQSVPATNGHNIVVRDDSALFCDSMHGRLMHGDKCVFQCDMFTRGLAYSGNLWLVGGSQYGQRDVRGVLDGCVYILNPGFKKEGIIHVPGMVQEIRMLAYDLCQSQYSMATVPNAASRTQPCEEAI